MSVIGVTFDGLHSYNDFGLWLAERPDKGSPEPKLNTVEISGADGIIDLTEANAGEVKFSNRTMKFTFSVMVDIPDQAEFQSKIMNALHGKVFKRIILDEDPDWYYNGRVGVTFKNIKPWKLQCEITVDAAPYAMKTEETVVDLLAGTSGSNRVDLAENVSTMEWNSDFRLGTREFPNGLPVDAQDTLYVEIPENPTVSPTSQHLLQISDSVSVYNLHFALSDYPTNLITIPYSDITNNTGVDLDSVYRVLVSGVGGCSLYVKKATIETVVQNARKTVYPMFAIEPESTVQITINGVSVGVGLGNPISYETPLKHGENKICVPQSASVTSFKMRFREGKL